MWHYGPELAPGNIPKQLHSIHKLGGDAEAVGLPHNRHVWACSLGFGQSGGRRGRLAGPHSAPSVGAVAVVLGPV